MARRREISTMIGLVPRRAAPAAVPTNERSLGTVDGGSRGVNDDWRNSIPTSIVMRPLRPSAEVPDVRRPLPFAAIALAALLAPTGALAATPVAPPQPTTRPFA